jgi:hypothetical protein
MSRQRIFRRRIIRNEKLFLAKNNPVKNVLRKESSVELSLAKNDPAKNDSSEEFSGEECSDEEYSDKKVMLSEKNS